jgi:hypothetical protein
VQAETIDDVISELDHILDRAREEGSRLGYFPALYRRVTRAVKAGIDNGAFADGEQLERLDVLFANRYLEAWRTFRAGGRPTAAWAAAFEAAHSPRPIVVQHLLLGINAHINLDLGIAAAATAPGPALAQLRPDFLAINDLLAAQVDGVKAALAAVWPKLRVLDWLAGPKDDRLINFSLSKARDHSWALAGELDATPAAERPARIATADRRVARLAHLVLHPGPLASFKTWVVRTGERGSVAEIIDLLS